MINLYQDRKIGGGFMTKTKTILAAIAVLVLSACETTNGENEGGGERVTMLSEPAQTPS